MNWPWIITVEVYFRASVESDISVFESAVEQQASSSEQQRALQEKLARTEREFDEVT